MKVLLSHHVTHKDAAAKRTLDQLSGDLGGGVPLCLHPEPALSSLDQGDGCGVPRRRLTTQLRGPLNEKEPGHLGSSEPTVSWGKAGGGGRSASILKSEGSRDLESGEIWGRHQRDLGGQGLWKLTWEFLAQLCGQWKSLTKFKKILFEQDGLISTQFSVPPCPGCASLAMLYSKSPR